MEGLGSVALHVEGCAFLAAGLILWLVNRLRWYDIDVDRLLCVPHSMTRIGLIPCLVIEIVLGRHKAVQNLDVIVCGQSLWLLCHF